MELKHTPGPWATLRDGWSTVYIEARIGSGLVQEVATCGPTMAGPEQQSANAAAISATPEALALAQNFEIKGPDDDGLLWLVLHGNGYEGQAMFNLGRAEGIAGQVAALFEEDRKAVLQKAGAQ